MDSLDQAPKAFGCQGAKTLTFSVPGRFKLQVRELTGDMNMTKSEIDATQVSHACFA